MPDSVSPNKRSPSTNDWVWKRTLRGAPPPQVQSPAEQGRKASLRSRDPRKPITIQLKYSGGSEAWWRVRARDVDWSFPGHLALQDVMDIINKTVRASEAQRRNRET